jgi:hypothetical protein
VWNRQPSEAVLVDPASTGLGHKQVQRWNLPEGWVISKHPAHAALVSEADFIAAQDAGRPAAAAGEGMTGAISVPVTAASAAGGETSQRKRVAAAISRAVRVFKRCSKKGDVPPLWVSEGGLEPPFQCDFPGSGKSWNKGNTSGVRRPGYPEPCSLFGPPSGLARGRGREMLGICSRAADCGCPVGSMRQHAEAFDVE